MVRVAHLGMSQLRKRVHEAKTSTLQGQLCRRVQCVQSQRIYRIHKPCGRHAQAAVVQRGRLQPQLPWKFRLKEIGN